MESTIARFTIGFCNVITLIATSPTEADQRTNEIHEAEKAFLASVRAKYGSPDWGLH